MNVKSAFTDEEGRQLPPNVYLPGLVQARGLFSLDPDAPDVSVEIVQWFRSNNFVTPTTGNLTGMAAIYDSNMANVFTVYGSADQQYIGSVFTDWSSATGVSISTVGTFTPVAGSKGATLPPNVAALTSWAVPLRFKGGHFRTYLPWVGEGAIDNTNLRKDTLAAAVVANLRTEWLNLLTAMLGSGILGGQVCVGFKNRHNAVTAETLQFTTITPRAHLASQRRRLRKAAHH